MTSVKMWKLTKIDVFAAINSLLFILMCIFVYYDRFISYRGKANIHEFFFYAAVIFSFILFVWRYFRHAEVSARILALIEFGILIHFAGAFVHYDGARLYDHRFFGLRFDKYVHFVNASIASMVVLYIFKRRDYVLNNFILFIAMLTVMGLGAFNEIVEFVAMSTIKNTGVGLYVNNMSDLAANFVGSLLTVVTYRLYQLRANYSVHEVLVEADTQE